jgi:hypothetical protein
MFKFEFEEYEILLDDLVVVVDIPVGIVVVGTVVNGIVVVVVVVLGLVE